MRNWLPMNPTIASAIPEAVLRKVEAMDPINQDAFAAEFAKRKKSVVLAYLLLGGGLHYAYVGKVWLTLFFIFTLGGFGLWWLIDLLRVPGIVKACNKSKAIDVLRDMQVLA